MVDQPTPPSIVDEVPTVEQDLVASVTPELAAPDYSAYLTGVVNKDGVQKFSTVEDALGSLAPANAHISRLEQENATLREAATKAKTTQEILDQLKPPAPAPALPANVTVDEARITELAMLALTAKEKSDLVKRNTTLVARSLANKFGSKEKVVEALASKADELGVGVQFLNDIAAKSPKALLQYFGMELGTEVSTVPQKITQGVNPSLLPNDPPKKKDIMYGATSKEIVSEWQRHKPQQ